MRSIANHQAQSEHVAGGAVIVDVREPVEFRDSHLPGALNLPLSAYDTAQYRDFQDRKICLVCHSGSRSREVASRLEREGFDSVFVLEAQMDAIARSSVSLGDSPSGWSVDRQFRMTLGVLLAFFLAGYAADLSAFVVIPVILSTGLIVTSLIDRCYMRAAIGRLPWNRGKTE